ncbi:aquaporin-like protein [Mycotypha africana]|uniref:aquaporin-like protein n=1 Tax=Mycotypha africana TaxID=64632 RepID=UPI002301F80A|nr:aquaporin-like protein [Mycotypha africana]KAI8981891.1 aquaporin-like protein [Mycotypha africana]
MRPISDIYACNKGSPPNLKVDLKAAFGEFLGMAIFLFLALSGTQGTMEAPITTNSNLGPTPSQIQSIAFSFGAGITVALFVCGPISGGVLNPAVLLSLMLTGNINWLRGILYFVAEIVGGIVGAYFSNFVTAHELQGVNKLNPGFNYAQGFFAESLLTCALCLTVLFIIVDRHLLADFAPFVVGIVVFMCCLVGAPIDGTSINPARSFAPSVVTGIWKDHWIMWFGPLVGGIFAVIIYITTKVLTEESQEQVLLQNAQNQAILEQQAKNNHENAMNNV